MSAKTMSAEERAEETEQTLYNHEFFDKKLRESRAQLV